jgi:nicotinate-nucleotide pyrophosphorylase (carboxylating)
MSIPFLNPLLVKDAVHSALLEDLGRAGDITTLSTIGKNVQAQGVIATRQNGVIVGLAFAREAFSQLDPDFIFTPHVEDGAHVIAGETIATLNGSARTLLSGERVALNFMGHLSGIATSTHAFVKAVAHTKARIVDTRKTIPGMRAFAKYAVCCGGGMNHRYGLDDAILIKDNHIAVAGGVIHALQAAKRAAGHLIKIEIEVDTLAQLDDVLHEGADVVLLDNMPPAMLREAVAKINGRIRSEASGGVSLESVAAIAETGVDMISIGALTHTVRALDLGLDIEVE